MRVAGKPRTGTGRHRPRAGAVVGLVLALAIVPHPTLTTASWTDAEYAAGAFTAGHIGAPTSFTCAVDEFVIDGVLQQALHFTWTAPAEPSLPPHAYDVVLSPESGIDPMSGTWSTDGPETELFIPTSTFLLRLGTSTATAYSTLGATWTSGAAAETPTVTVTSSILGVLVECG